MKNATRPGVVAGLLVTGWLFVASRLLAAEDFSREAARLAPTWLQGGVIYEIFPRNFSPEGTFNGITSRLDELADLGVNILWLMPIHPIGEKMRKGALGSPYAVRDYHAINPDQRTGCFERLSRRTIGPAWLVRPRTGAPI